MEISKLFTRFFTSFYEFVAISTKVSTIFMAFSIIFTILNHFYDSLIFLEIFSDSNEIFDNFRNILNNFNVFFDKFNHILIDYGNGMNFNTISATFAIWYFSSPKKSSEVTKFRDAKTQHTNFSDSLSNTGVHVGKRIYLKLFSNHIEIF